MRSLTFLLGICIAKRSATFTPEHPPINQLFSRQQHKISRNAGINNTPILPSSSSLQSVTGGGKNFIEPRSLNEFSRPYRTDIVLGVRRREYATQISAEPEELEGLAKRFSLSRISKLEADIVLRTNQPIRGSGGGGRVDDMIRAEVDIVASVTQTCVRTNEDFEIELDIHLAVLVRACEAQVYDTERGQTTEEMDVYNNNQKSKKKKRKRGKNLGTNGQVLNQMKMNEMQDFLQDADSEIEIIEDLAIFGSDGILDAGELVAQSLRLKLNPFPKKPGTEPVTYSITG